MNEINTIYTKDGKYVYKLIVKSFPNEIYKSHCYKLNLGNQT